MMKKLFNLFKKKQKDDKRYKFTVTDSNGEKTKITVIAVDRRTAVETVWENYPDHLVLFEGIK